MPSENLIEVVGPAGAVVIEVRDFQRYINNGYVQKIPPPELSDYDVTSEDLDKAGLEEEETDPEDD